MKDLLVVLSAKISGYVKSINEALTLTQGASSKIGDSATKISDSMNGAFGGGQRAKIQDLGAVIAEQKKVLIEFETELKQLQDQLKNSSGTNLAEQKRLKTAIENLKGTITEQRQAVKGLSQEQTNLRQSLASNVSTAEQNQQAFTALNQSVSAASSAVLLMSGNNETLKTILGGVNVAMSVANAAISLQNLNLKENAVFAGIAAKVQGAFTVATTGATAAMTAFATVLAALGIGLVIAGIYAAVKATTEYNKKIDETIDKELELYKTREKQGKESFDNGNKAFKQATEIRILEAQKAGLADAKLANFEIDLLKKRRTELRLLATSSKVTQSVRAAALAEYNDISDEIYKKELTRDINLIKSQEKVNKAKQKKADKKQAVDEQSGLGVQEIQLNRERLLTTATTEAERAKIINQSEQEILDLKKASAFQQIQAQNLSATKSKELFNSLALEQIKISQDAEKRLQDARNRDTDNALAAEETKYLGIKESQEGTLKLFQDQYDAQLNQQTEAFNAGTITAEQYELEKTRITLEGLKKRLELQKEFGISTAETEKQIADITLKGLKDATKERERLVRDSNRAIEGYTRQLFQDVATSLGESLAEIASSGNPLQALFNGLLRSVASFMDAFGKSLIAVGVAQTKLKVALASGNPALAIAGGVALIAAAGVARNMTKQGATAFAQGGIVSGPTLGLVGEYPGASTNPEVIAPLDKLQKLIGGANDSDGGFIAETRISGRDLAVVLSRYQKDSTRG